MFHRRSFLLLVLSGVIIRAKTEHQFNEQIFLEEVTTEPDVTKKDEIDANTNDYDTISSAIQRNFVEKDEKIGQLLLNGVVTGNVISEPNTTEVNNIASEIETEYSKIHKDAYKDEIKKENIEPNSTEYDNIKVNTTEFENITSESSETEETTTVGEEKNHERTVFSDDAAQNVSIEPNIAKQENITHDIKGKDRKTDTGINKYEFQEQISSKDSTSAKQHKDNIGDNYSEELREKTKLHEIIHERENIEPNFTDYIEEITEPDINNRDNIVGGMSGDLENINSDTNNNVFHERIFSEENTENNISLNITEFENSTNGTQRKFVKSNEQFEGQPLSEEVVTENVITELNSPDLSYIGEITEPTINKQDIGGMSEDLENTNKDINNSEFHERIFPEEITQGVEQNTTENKNMSPHTTEFENITSEIKRKLIESNERFKGQQLSEEVVTENAIIQPNSTDYDYIEKNTKSNINNQDNIIAGISGDVKNTASDTNNNVFHERIVSEENDEVKTTENNNIGLNITEFVNITNETQRKLVKSNEKFEGQPLSEEVVTENVITEPNSPDFSYNGEITETNINKQDITGGMSEDLENANKDINNSEFHERIFPKEIKENAELENMASGIVPITTEREKVEPTENYNTDANSSEIDNTTSKIEGEFKETFRDNYEDEFGKRFFSEEITTQRENVETNSTEYENIGVTIAELESITSETANNADQSNDNDSTEEAENLTVDIPTTEETTIPQILNNTEIFSIRMAQNPILNSTNATLPEIEIGVNGSSSTSEKILPKPKTIYVELFEDSNYMSKGNKLFLQYPNLRKVPPEIGIPNNYSTPKLLKLHGKKSTTLPSTWMTFSTTTESTTTTRAAPKLTTNSSTTTTNPLGKGFYDLNILSKKKNNNNTAVIQEVKRPLKYHVFKDETSPKDGTIKSLLKFIIECKGTGVKNQAVGCSAPKINNNSMSEALYENELYKLTGDRNFNSSLSESIAKL